MGVLLILLILRVTFFIQKCRFSDKLISLFVEVLTMSEALKNVLENIEHMTSSEKALAAHCLLSSLEEKPDDDVDSAWLALSEERSNELSTGEVKAVSWEQIKSQIVK
jgi:hypothetical protein